MTAKKIYMHTDPDTNFFIEKLIDRLDPGDPPRGVKKSLDTYKFSAVSSITQLLLLDKIADLAQEVDELREEIRQIEHSQSII